MLYFYGVIPTILLTVIAKERRRYRVTWPRRVRLRWVRMIIILHFFFSWTDAGLEVRSTLVTQNDANTSQKANTAQLVF